MAVSGLPFDDFRDLLSRLPGPDEEAAAKTSGALCVLRGETASLGRIETVAEWLSAWSGRAPPRVLRPAVTLFAGTHGVSASLGHADAVRRARERVERLSTGTAPINRICLANDLGLKVFDLALDLPTGDISKEAALDERSCAATMAFGMEAIAGADLVCIGDLGADGAVAARAVLAALSDRGTDGLAGAGKADEAVADALALHGDHLDDPLEVLRRLGGREIAAAAGAILAARMEKVPVLLSGLGTTAAAAILHRADPTALDHCLLADADGPAHRAVAAELGMEPLLDLGIRDGAGAGAAIAAGVARTAARVAADGAVEA